jgi:HEAT repeat protein
MDVAPEIQALLDRLPAPDKDGKFTGPAPAEAEALCREILAGGRDRVLALAGLVGEPGPGDDWKARYLLHGLAVHVGRPGAEADRKMLVEALASQLDGERPKDVKAFLCQELQAAGTREAVPWLGRLLLDADLVEPAAMALLAIADGAAETFRAALPRTQGLCRLTILQDLGVLRDVASGAAFTEALGDADREIRLAGGWGLARLADPAAVASLLKAADGAEGWERIQATKHCLVLAENLAAAGKTAESRAMYEHLGKTRTDPSERYIQILAIAALK